MNDSATPPTPPESRRASDRHPRTSRCGARSLTAAIVALAVALGAVVARSEDSVEAANTETWQYQLEMHAMATTGLAGAIAKDWAEGKLGKYSNLKVIRKSGSPNAKPSWKLSDTKKYGFGAGVMIAMGVLAFGMPDPASAFNRAMLEELTRIGNKLEEMNQRVLTMLQKSQDMLDALDKLLANNLVADLLSYSATIQTEFAGTNDSNYRWYTEVLDSYGAHGPSDETLDDIHAYFTTLGQTIGPATFSFRNGTLSMISEAAKVESSNFGTAPDDEDAFYAALWSFVLYADAVSAMAAQMLIDYYFYWADHDPAGAESWLALADNAYELHLEFKRSLFGAVGAPAGTEDYAVYQDADGWWIDGTADTPLRDWYEFGDGDERVALDPDDHSFNVAGRPSANSAVWMVTPEGDGVVKVYKDDVEVDEIEGAGVVMPGPDVDRVTLADDRSQVAAEGWSLLGVPADDDDALHYWTGDVNAYDAVTVEVEPMGWAFFDPVFEPGWSVVDTTVTGPGSIEVWEEGAHVTTIDASFFSVDADPEGMLVADFDSELVLTTDPSVAADPDTLMALLATDNELVRWSPELGPEDHVVTMGTDDRLIVDAMFSQNAANAVTFDVDGPGRIDVYADSIIVAAIDESTPEADRSVLVHGESLTVTNHLDDVPMNGWAAVAHQPVNTEFVGWSGAHTGSDATVVTLDGTEHLGAEFWWLPASYEIETAQGGVVELWEDGALAVADVSGTTIEVRDDVLVATDPTEISDVGAALLPVADSGHSFYAWFGAHEGQQSTTIPHVPNAVSAVRADFVDDALGPQPTTIRVDTAGSGSVDEIGAYR